MDSARSRIDECMDVALMDLRLHNAKKKAVCMHVWFIGRRSDGWSNGRANAGWRFACELVCVCVVAGIA